MQERRKLRGYGMDLMANASILSDNLLITSLLLEGLNQGKLRNRRINDQADRLTVQ